MSSHGGDPYLTGAVFAVAAALLALAAAEYCAKPSPSPSKKKARLGDGLCMYRSLLRHMRNFIVQVAVTASFSQSKICFPTRFLICLSSFAGHFFDSSASFGCSFWSELAGGRFAALGEYFDETTTKEEVMCMPVDVLLSACEARDRTLMQVFIEREVLPAQAYIEPPASPSRRPVAQPAQVMQIHDALADGALRLSGGRVLPGYALGVRGTIGWSLERILKDLRDLSKKELESISVLDLSANHLVNDDLADVSKVVQDLPSLQVLDLSNNRLTSGAALEDFLAELLDRVTVDIRSNSAASIDSAYFLASLPCDRAGRLIWVPQPYLDTDGWRAMLQKHGAKDALIADIVHAHKAYDHK